MKVVPYRLGFQMPAGCSFIRPSHSIGIVAASRPQKT